MIDKAKRKKIMERSIALGHCICNPKQACPCALFKEKNVCLCAGERMEDAEDREVKLTEFVENAGCASKINQNDLKIILEGLPKINDPRVLVSADTCDDAGVYKLDNGMALVQSVDVFTPVVDDPYTFGEIAAANSVSDIYAMGGIPLTALSIVGFPIEILNHKVMTRMLQGGIDKMKEAGVLILGGHSIKDNEIKFGFAVTGLIDPARIITNDKARPGDLLILTKPLGTGVISFARQMGKASRKAVETISRSMTELNKIPAEILQEMDIFTATDVTGFGLIGHLIEMASQSRVKMEIFTDQVPLFPEALEYLKRKMISGAIERNKEYASRFVCITSDVPEEMETILYDPQTSGGLLIAVEEKKGTELIRILHSKGIKYAGIIGLVEADSKEGQIVLKKNTNSINIAEQEKTELNQPEIHSSSCCDPDASGHLDAERIGINESEGIQSVKDKFSKFMGLVNADGAVSLKNKELIAIALSCLSKCEPCVTAHIEKARSLGLTDEEINEAVWLAISFGGAPIMMFFNQIKEALSRE